MDILTIGILGVLAYFALQDRQPDEPGGGNQGLPGFNPGVSVGLFQVETRRDEILVTLNFELSATPDGKDFKNNRVAGSLFYGNQEIATFRDASNFTFRGNKPKSVKEIVKFPVEYSELISNLNFWRNVRAVGDFEAKDKTKIYFNNPIGLESFKGKETPFQFSDLSKAFFG